MMRNIEVRFDKINSLAFKDKDHTGFARHKLPQVPDIGEIVSLKGDPYSVMERGWAVDEDSNLFAYLRMLPAF